MATHPYTQADLDAAYVGAVERELARLDEMTMGLSFSDADPVARCHVRAWQWHGHGDSINDAVLAWTAHLTAVHRNDWPE